MKEPDGKRMTPRHVRIPEHDAGPPVPAGIAHQGEREQKDEARKSESHNAEDIRHIGLIHDRQHRRLYKKRSGIRSALVKRGPEDDREPDDQFHGERNHGSPAEKPGSHRKVQHCREREEKRHRGRRHVVRRGKRERGKLQLQHPLRHDGVFPHTRVRRDHGGSHPVRAPSVKLPLFQGSAGIHNGNSRVLYRERRVDGVPARQRIRDARDIRVPGIEGHSLLRKIEKQPRAQKESRRTGGRAKPNPGEKRLAGVPVRGKKLGEGTEGGMLDRLDTPGDGGEQEKRERQEKRNRQQAVQPLPLLLVRGDQRPKTFPKRSVFHVQRKSDHRNPDRRMKERLHDEPAEPCEVFGEFGRFPDSPACHANIPALQENDDRRPGEDGGEEKETQDLRRNGIRREVRMNGKDLTEGIHPADHRDFPADAVWHPRRRRQEMKEVAVPVRADFLMKGAVPEHYGKARPFAAAGIEFVAIAIRADGNPSAFGFLTVPKKSRKGRFSGLWETEGIDFLVFMVLDCRIRVFVGFMG